MSVNENLLIDHLDKSLEGQELSEVEQLILNDEQALKEWQLLQFTAANIYEAGLYAQVSEIRDRYIERKNNSAKQNSNPGVVISMTRKIIRVAAVMVFVIFSAALYKYISVNDSSIYNEYYSSYELQTSRGQLSDDQLDNAYKNKNWLEVIAIVNGIQNRNSKHFFTAGVANLELERYGQAIISFQSVINTNQVSGDDYFNDEAEYFLAMSYLASKESEKAVSILEKIRKDKGHLYNETVNKMGIDLKILQLKRGK